MILGNDSCSGGGSVLLGATVVVFGPFDMASSTITGISNVELDVAAVNRFFIAALTHWNHRSFVTASLCLCFHSVVPPNKEAIDHA